MELRFFAVIKPLTNVPAQRHALNRPVVLFVQVS